jgi:putative two-component system response regulator
MLDQTNPVTESTAPRLVNGSLTHTLAQSSDSSLDRDALANKIKRLKIFIVDDEEANVLITKRYLEKAGYDNCIYTTDSTKAIDIAINQKPDLILLDIRMPNINGLEILKLMKQNPVLREMAVVVLTAETDPKIKTCALEFGANDILTKPIDAVELIPRVRSALTVKTHLDQIANQKAELEEQVRSRTKELFQSRQQIILSLARAAEHRDNETGNHVIRVGVYSALIAHQIGWEPDAIEMLQQAAQLHDVGKIGIPDEILFKPGKLDPDEFAIIEKHCMIGKNIIAPFEASERDALRAHARLGQGILHIRNSPLMMMAARIAQTHHENWDGKGYPLGLAGEDIPIEGRIVAIADVFDALSSARPYKAAFPREKCFEIMNEMRGAKLDPFLLDAFYACGSKIVEVQMALADEE